jgi:hypothetical protein
MPDAEPQTAPAPQRAIDAHIDDVVDLSRIYRETANRIDAYMRAVNDGQELQAALDFGGFVLWSGIIGLCRRYSRSSPKIDGDFLRWKAEELQRQVRERWRDSGQRARLDKDQIEGINRRLDMLAAQVARCHVHCPHPGH